MSTNSSPAETVRDSRREIASPSPTGLRLLFAKQQLAYPRAQGHDIHGFNMMRSFHELGHQVGLAAFESPSARAVEGLRLDYLTTLHERDVETLPPMAPLTWVQRRFASYFGAADEDTRRLGAAVTDYRPDIVIGLGADILPYLVGSGAPRSVWYVADEWVLHYGSLARLKQPKTWGNLGTAAIWGLYERAFAGGLDRIWVVTEQDARSMRRWAGAERVDVLPNGVDSAYYTPQPVSERLRTAVFWGRLDFLPNLQALDWFCHKIWPLLHERFPDAAFRIIGFCADDRAHALTKVPGVVLTPDLPDLRGAVCEQAVVVMPFQSGGGIKNKLLEGASMGKAIVSTSVACQGLRGDPAVVVASRPQEWVEAIARLWTDEGARRQLGADARAWVLREHSWRRTAEDAAASLRR